MTFESEQALCAEIHSWLTRKGWEVYSEVGLVPGGPVADLVGVHKRNRVAWIIEAKLQLGLRLLAQADAWRAYGIVSIAIPERNVDEGLWPFTEQVLRKQFIGALFVGPGAVTEVVPTRNTASDSCVRHLLDALRDEHKTWAPAGIKSGQRFTKFQETRAALVRAVQINGPISVQDLLKIVPTHWGGRVGTERVKQLAKRGQLPGVRCRWNGRRYMLEVDETEAA